MKLKVITPEKVVFDDEVLMVNIDTEKGQLGILPHHADFISKVIPGVLRIKKENQKEEVLATGEGILQMVKNNIVVLTDLAENEADISEKEAEDARKRAQDALEQKLSDEEYADTLAILERSLAKLKVKRRHHNH